MYLHYTIVSHQRFYFFVNNCVMQIHGVGMMEDLFVETFKPGGHMHDDILEALRLIWNKSWDDRIMLSLGAVVSAN